MADLVGKRLKDFAILRRLGRGAMAEVYLAQQVTLDRQVALKVLNEELARDPNYVRRFHHEARAAAALVHGGIVQIYEVGQEDGIHFIAQEYVAGRNLGELIRTSGSLSPRLTLDILRQVTSALQKASSQGIVHRDIKPENIMVSAGTGEVKVADFGLARVQGDGGASSLTQVGVTMGTPLYMSPEQIEGRELDSRSDIYSLGVTAYHMLAGEPPFSGDSPLTVAVQHLNQPAPPLIGRRPDVPDRLAHIIDRMLAKKPAERFSDPAALSGELQAVAVEGAEQGWADVPDAMSLSQMIHAANERVEATTRLDELMKSSQSNRPRRWWRGGLVAAIVGCSVLGAALALISRPASLLADAQGGPPPQGSVWAQLYHAKVVDTELAWKAVEQNFPDVGAYGYHHNLAREGLAYYYLQKVQNYEKALEPLEALASLSEREQRFRAFGIAGLVVAYANLGEDELAYNANQRLDPGARALLQEEAPRMDRMLNAALDELANRSL